MITADPREVRRWFAGRGFTSLLEGTAIARRSLSYRFVVSLAVVLLVVVGLPAVLPDDAGWTADVWVAVMTIGGALVFWIVSNLVRKRPLFAVPARVGWAERTAFVAIPTVAAFIAPGSADQLGIQLTDLMNRIVIALGWLVGQLLLLAVVAVVVNSGVWTLAVWLRRQVTSSFLVAGGALSRTLPVLLGVVGFFFFTSELWQSLGRLDGWGYWVALLLFVVLSWVFLASRGHLDLDELAYFASLDSLQAELADTPLSDVSGVEAPVTCPLTRDQENNLRFVAAISRMTVATVISAAVFIFFVSFGVLVANAEAVAAWATHAPRVLAQWATPNHTYAVTVEHLKVAGFLGVFSGFYFAIVSATDPAMRAGLRDTAEDAIREACAARVVALARYPRVNAT